ncbi:MAG: Ig-like domain-containing protein, partial [Bacillota bacterium]|nr:Ig-like domain-containing protein [Bacillota bacterium]
VTAFDKNGCAKLAYEHNSMDKLIDPELWAVQITDSHVSHVVFLEEEDFTSEYSGDISMDKYRITQGETLNYSGIVRPSYFITSMAESVTVELRGKSGCILRNKPEVGADGAFGGSLDELMLPEGNYRLCALIKGREIAAADFVVEGSPEGTTGELLVSCDDKEVAPGDTLTLRVRAILNNGKPLSGLNIVSSQGTVSGLTDENGEAFIYITAETIGSLAFYTGTVDISASLGKEILTATASYNIIREDDSDYEETPFSAFPDSGGESEYVSAISMTEENGDFVISTGLSESAAFSVGFDGESYSVELPGSNLSMETPDSYELMAGEALEIEVTVSGGYNNSVSAQLYKGVLPAAAAGKSFYNEDPLVPQEKAIAGYINTNGYFTFTTNALKGSYYLRLLAEDRWGNSLCRYVPVEIKDGGAIFVSTRYFYAEGDEIVLDFSVEGQELTYIVFLDDEQVAEGEVDKHTSLSLGTPEVGVHQGFIELYSSRALVDRKAISFIVYKPESGFMAISDEATEASAELYAVAHDEKEYFKKLFSYNLFPGNQLLQVMGRNEFYGALGENAGILSTYINNDFYGFQNEDGSFGRLPGAKGDLLLSALVAMDKDALYD